MNSQYIDLRFVIFTKRRVAVARLANTTHTTVVATYIGRRESGSTKFGCTPGGGCSDGFRDGSTAAITHESRASCLRLLEEDEVREWVDQNFANKILYNTRS